MPPPRYRRRVSPATQGQLLHQQLQPLPFPGLGPGMRLLFAFSAEVENNLSQEWFTHTQPSTPLKTYFPPKKIKLPPLHQNILKGKCSTDTMYTALPPQLRSEIREKGSPRERCVKLMEEITGYLGTGLLV